MPNLRPRPKFSKNVSYASRSVSRIFSSSLVTRFSTRRAMALSWRSCCRVSREMLSETSLGIHDAAHEVVVVGQQVGALVHDEDVGAVERETLLVVLAVQVERGAAGDEQQRVILERALGMEAHCAGRVLEVVEGRLIELVVVLVGHVGAALLPNRGHGVDGIELLVVLILRCVILAGVLGALLLAALGDHHLDGIAHVVAVALDEVLQAPLGRGKGRSALAGLAVLAGNVRSQMVRIDVEYRLLRSLAVLDGVALEAVEFPHLGRVAPRRSG